ncbi:MAG: purine-nucleoside phosphorylase [Campylobacterales bacterium]
MIICAGQIEQIPGAWPVGIGMVEAAINLTRLCLLSPPPALLFAGTAGSYGGFDLLDVVESRRAANVEVAYLQNAAYTPIDNAIALENVSRETSFPETVVNSSNYITTESKAAERFRRLGLGIENMEFFAIMKVAAHFEIPAKGVFVITNHVGKDAHKEYLANRDAAIRTLDQVIQRYYRAWQ